MYMNIVFIYIFVYLYIHIHLLQDIKHVSILTVSGKPSPLPPINIKDNNNGTSYDNCHNDNNKIDINNNNNNDYKILCISQH
jgi:hypothetical protein